MRSRWHRAGCWCRHPCSHWHGERPYLRSKVLSFTYSRAQRYGSNARILGRAHVCRSNSVFLEAIMRDVGVQSRCDIGGSDGGDFLNEYRGAAAMSGVIHQKATSSQISPITRPSTEEVKRHEGSTWIFDFPVMHGTVVLSLWSFTSYQNAASALSVTCCRQC